MFFSPGVTSWDHPPKQTVKISVCAGRSVYVWINLWSDRTCRAKRKQKLRSPVPVHSGFKSPLCPFPCLPHTLPPLYCYLLVFPLFFTYMAVNFPSYLMPDNSIPCYCPLAPPLLPRFTCSSLLMLSRESFQRSGRQRGRFRDSKRKKRWINPNENTRGK